MKPKRRNYKTWLIVLLLLLLIPAVGWFLLVPMEGEKPSLSIDLPSAAIGASQELTVDVADQKCGLRNVRIALMADGKEIVLLDKQYPHAGLLTGGQVHAESLNIPLEPRKLGIDDGEITLRLAVRDYSWRGWWRGNLGAIDKAVRVDTKPPGIDVLTRFHNISQGGAGLIIYKLSESCSTSGVVVGDKFFPGHPGYFEDADIWMAFFALGYGQGKGTRLFVKAMDAAGNLGRSGFPHYIRGKTFKNDTINLSDGFLDAKMPEFAASLSQRADVPNLEKFQFVNSQLRQDNYKKFLELAQTSDEQLHWKGVFLRLPKSATMAGFADHRVYRYQGRVVDRQVHLGVDLASVSHSPIPAANDGRVAFVGTIGIYGRTVLLDHGFGLFSVYAHMSSIEVEKDQMVSKGEILGRTGMTGLAGGDHLHFGMMVHNTFVSPLEWWDPAWISNNITTKINSVGS